MRMKNKLLIKKILVIVFILFSFICLVSPKTFAEDIDPNYYNTTVTYGEAADLFSKASRVLTVLRAIAVMVAVISISILGIQYMLGSVEEKAQYKEKMIPIVIGAILVSGISSILISINNLMN